MGGSTHGSFVDNSYMIRVSLDMEVFCDCCSQDPCVELPITIVTEIQPLPTLEKP